MTEPIYDLAIVGGGINGTGIAAYAAGRGLGVLLAESGDLGGATSSASSKLIHGGLRYLEQYEFRLVREALAERERLLGLAPHIGRPLGFVLLGRVQPPGGAQCTGRGRARRHVVHTSAARAGTGARWRVARHLHARG